MVGVQFPGDGYHLGPRVPTLNMEEHVNLKARAEEGTLPVSTSSLTVPITLAVVIPLIIAFCVLVHLHRRTAARHRKEDEMDPNRTLDFGLDVAGKNGKRKSLFGMEKGGTNAPHSKQLSMDMNLSSPYLLPPAMQNSRESLNSLARSLHTEDPYRPVNQYTGSDVGSIRSFAKGRQDSNPSIYTGMSSPSNARSMSTKSSNAFVPPPRQNSLPPPPMPSTSTASPVQATFNFEVPQSKPEITSPPPAARDPFRLNQQRDSDIAPAQFPQADYDPPQTELPKVPQIQEPAPIARKGLSQGSRTTSDKSIKEDHSYIAGLVSARDSDIIPGHQAQGLGIMNPAMGKNLPSSPRPTRKASLPPQSAHASVDYYDGSEQFRVTPPEQDQYASEGRGRSVQRQNAIPEDYPLSAGLDVPAHDNRRLSVGVRPLPPDDYLESEDPEFRANRIRSFYKEYFDDSKGPHPPMPPLPQSHGAQSGYEGYGDNYLGDAAYFDPDTNAFVMPYAEPVTRRAMTPPPKSRKPMGRSGPRGPGGPGPMGHMPSPGRPRAGSTMSGSGWGPRPDSSSSSQWGARAGSSMSGAGRQPPKKKLPPPTALTTLPTPSKLRDDSFAIFNAADFAPPPTMRDQAAGRSQSPLGERRPYQMNVPAHSPLVSAFDETPSLPSPHLLRKSATFTALDFAAPRRFQDPDNMSDAGSIRSNRSGISARNLGAIRNGAGRVSRLPGDAVFTAASLQDQLKPSWNMREAVDKK